MTISNADLTIFLQKPISLALLVIAVLALVAPRLLQLWRALRRSA